MKATTARNVIYARIVLTSSALAVEAAVNAFWFVSPVEKNVKTAPTAVFVRTAEHVWTVSEETATTA